MQYEIVEGFARARLLAAVRRTVRLGEVGRAWRPALDEVWPFIRATPGLWAGGHNVFLYHHPQRREDPMDVDFGVEVTHAFEPVGDVRPTSTPAGRTVTAVHVGAIEGIRGAHDAIHAWAAANGRLFAGVSWEIYGDWTDDVTGNEVRVVYLLEPGDQPQIEASSVG